MVTDGLEQMTVRLEYGCSPQKSHQVLSQKSHQRSQSTGCVLVRKAQTNPHTVRQQHHRPKADGSFQGSPRWGFKRHPRQGVNVKSTWPGCEVELGTCHCLPYDVHLVHTRIPGGSSPTTENILCGGDPPRGLSDETTSLGAMATAMASQLQPFKFSRTWTTSARRKHVSRTPRVWSNRENCKDFWLQSHLQHPPQKDPKG